MAPEKQDDDEHESHNRPDGAGGNSSTRRHLASSPIPTRGHLQQSMRIPAIEEDRSTTRTPKRTRPTSSNLDDSDSSWDRQGLPELLQQVTRGHLPDARQQSGDVSAYKDEGKNKKSAAPLTKKEQHYEREKLAHAKPGYIPNDQDQNAKSTTPDQQQRNRRQPQRAISGASVASAVDSDGDNSWDQHAMPELLMQVSRALPRAPPPVIMTESLLAAAMPPPPLHREQEHNETPGAYMEAPGRDTIRRQKVHIMTTDAVEPAENEDPPSLTFGESPGTPSNEAVEPDVEQAAAPANPTDGIRDSLLIEALPVEDDDDNNSRGVNSVATPVPRTEEEEHAIQRKRLLQRTALFVGIGVLLVVGILLIVFFEVEESKGPKMVNATTMPTMAPTVTVLPGLPDYTVEAILLDHNSPQAKANRWLLGDPNWQNYTSSRLVQRFALATLFYATTTKMEENGTTTQTSWTRDDHWLSYNHHECDWYAQPDAEWFAIDGLSSEQHGKAAPCNEEGNYQRIWLAGVGLVGTIPLELYELSSLTTMDLQNNKGLTGSIAPHVEKLSNLTHVGWAHTSIAGTLPPEIGNLSSLRTLRLLFTLISGTMPSELGQLKKLDTLYIGFSQITGSIPSELGLLTRLHKLDLTFNQLTGPIPPELAGLHRKLQHFVLGNNLLSSTIPRELEAFSGVYNMHLSNNLLEGSLPSFIGMMRELRELSVSQNALTGRIATEIGLLKHLYGMNLEGNNFTLIPTQIGLMESLVQTYFDGNPLRSIPSELGLLSSLTLLSLPQAKLESIPTEFGTLNSLVDLDMSGNNLVSIPSEVAQLQQLAFLDISNNELSSIFFLDQFGAPPLIELGFSFNKLNGLPSELWSMSSLQTLLMDQPFGSPATEAMYLPTEVGQLRMLQVLVSRGAGWAGSLPAEIGELDQLAYLYLNNNSFAGSIPSGWSGLISNGSIRELSLSDNQLLTGEVPKELCALEDLFVFECSEVLCGCNCTCNTPM